MWLTGQSIRLILGGLVAVGVLIPMWRSSVEAVPITLQGQSADLGNLLVRQTLQGDFGTTCMAIRGANGKCVPASVFTFNNAPAPLSDGILTVVAAGDVGHRQGERDQAGFVVTDFVTVFNPNKDPIGTLYSSTIPNCPGAGETGGFQADKTTVCGPNIHSVKPTGTDDAPGGSVAVLGQAAVPNIFASEPIKLGHKIALCEIPSGQAIIKFGVPIGRATRDIAAGQWVHLHNCASDFDQRSGTLDVQTGAATDTKYE